MAFRKIPNELIYIIYDLCNFQTRMRINQALNWNFKIAHPVEGIKKKLSR